MKIQVEFLSVPQITRLVGGKSIDFSMQGSTIMDLIGEMSRRYGREIEEFLLEPSGHLDAVFKILRNKTEWIPGNRLETPLDDGDRITFMLLVGGG